MAHELLEAFPWDNAPRYLLWALLIVLNETGLGRTLKSYFEYYERTRTYLSLGKDAPVSRPIQATKTGRIAEIPQVGGLQHRYERVAA